MKTRQEQGDVELLRQRISSKEMELAARTYFYTKDSKIRENLIFYNFENAKKTLNKLILFDIDEEDINQMAYLLLIEAIDSFDPNKHRSFLSYVRKYIFFRFVGKKGYYYTNIYIKLIEESKKAELSEDIINRTIRDYFKEKNVELDDYQIECFKRKLGFNNDMMLDGLEIEDPNSFEDTIIDKEVIKDINNFLSKYPFKRRVEVFYKVFDLDHDNVYTYEKIANETYTTRENIRKLILSTFADIRKNYKEFIPDEFENKKTNAGIEKLFIRYYKTKDLSIRTDLFIEHVSLALQLSKVYLNNIDEEDKTKKAFELMLNAIDEYNPYESRDGFDSYVRKYFEINANLLDESNMVLRHMIAKKRL